MQWGCLELHQWCLWPVVWWDHGLKTLHVLFPCHHRRNPSVTDCLKQKYSCPYTEVVCTMDPKVERDEMRRRRGESGAQRCSIAFPCCAASACPNWQLRCLSVHHAYCIHIMWVKPCILWSFIEILIPQLSLREFLGVYSFTSAGWNDMQEYLYDLPDWHSCDKPIQHYKQQGGVRSKAMSSVSCSTHESFIFEICAKRNAPESKWR